MEEYRYKDGSLLRKGYTTGTCAALAARAALMGLISGRCPEQVSLQVPAGTWISARPEEPGSGIGEAGNRFFQCAVRKDAGDDPDVTDGLLIFCRAEFGKAEKAGEKKESVVIRGGKGVGRVTRKGLDQPVGEAAINSVPRAMIRRAVTDILKETGQEQPLILTISVPGGEEAAEKTFNPLLGIMGGISILGTTGIVEPMSEEALVETIRAQLQVLRARGRSWIAAAPGNMGAVWAGTVLKNTDEDSVVICSNHIGRTIDMAAELGFSGLLLFGHLGKFVKLGNGIMNTHSREGDGRLDTMVSCALMAGADLELLNRLRNSNTTEEALGMLSEAGLEKRTMEILLDRIRFHLNRRAAGALETGACLFSQETGFLGMTEGADRLAEQISREQEKTKQENTERKHTEQEKIHAVTENRKAETMGTENVQTEKMETKNTQAEMTQTETARTESAPPQNTDYDLLCRRMEALAEDVCWDMTNLANGAALLYDSLSCVNWAGFYLLRQGELMLGPFQGKAACTRISMGKGVCGTAAENDRTVLVEDVHRFPGHIACDSASRSEIVVPLHKNGTLYGVLDLDSPVVSRFSERDREGLEKFAAILERHI